MKYTSWVGRNIELKKHSIGYKLHLYEVCKRENESLFIGEIDVSLIEDTYDLFSCLKSIFKKKLYNLLDEELNDYASFRNNYLDLYVFSKICYFSEIYLKDNKFKYPLTAYHNCRTRSNVIHPGMHRLAVYELFDVKNIPCIYFNTGGYSLEDIGIVNYRNFQKTTIPELIENNKNLVFEFVFDHGSIIPQFHFLDFSWEKEMIPYILKVRNTLKNLKLKMNHRFSFLNEFIDNNNYHSEINFSKFFTQLDVCRALVFSVIKHNYRSENLTVINQTN